jgi:hypothetical protein
VVTWLVVIERLPEASPIATGANLPVKVALCPSANANGSDGPVTAKPPPDATALMTVKAVGPEFVRVTVCLPLEPNATFPKVRLVGLAVRFPDEVVHPDCVTATTRAATNMKNLKGLRQIETLCALALMWGEFEAT